MKVWLSRKVVVSCFLAACLEMYDFSIFGFFSSMLHKNYLEFMDANQALIASYALFAVGFVFRPIGSLIFGFIGDRYGRKKALVLSVSLMGTASLSMSVLPTYQAIGILACYIIILVRIVQGISVGGEYSGALIYTLEHFDRKKAGIIGGIIISGAMSGALLATLVSNLVKLPIFSDNGWRLAFLLGFGLSVIGYFIRKNLQETPEFQKISSNTTKIPLLEGIRKYKIECVAATLLAAANGVNFYFILVFLPNYLNKISDKTIGWYPVVTTLILIVLSPIFSWWSDRIERGKLIGYSLLIISIYSFVGFNVLSHKPSIPFIISLLVGQAVIFASQAATVNIFIVEIFPVKYRFSCASVCYSLGIGTIGGTSPLIAALIVEKFGENHSVYLGAFLGSVSLIAALGTFLVIRKTRNQ